MSQQRPQPTFDTEKKSERTETPTAKTYERNVS